MLTLAVRTPPACRFWRRSPPPLLAALSGCFNSCKGESQMPEEIFGIHRNLFSDRAAPTVSPISAVVIAVLNGS